MTAPMDQIEIDREVRRFLADTFLFGRTEDLRDHVSLMGNVIDSTGAIELVTFLQDRFAIEVEDTDVIPENFDSPKNIVDYVERKLRTKT
jgi:acyl carrier protein